MLNAIKDLILKPKAQDLHDRAKISLSVFEDCMNELRTLNQLALAHTDKHQQIINESQSEISLANQLVAKNSKIIDKINDILN